MCLQSIQYNIHLDSVCKTTHERSVDRPKLTETWSKTLWEVNQCAFEIERNRIQWNISKWQCIVPGPEHNFYDIFTTTTETTKNLQKISPIRMFREKKYNLLAKSDKNALLTKSTRHLTLVASLIHKALNLFVNLLRNATKIIMKAKSTQRANAENPTPSEVLKNPLNEERNEHNFSSHETRNLFCHSQTHSFADIQLKHSSMAFVTMQIMPSIIPGNAKIVKVVSIVDRGMERKKRAELIISMRILLFLCPFCPHKFVVSLKFFFISPKKSQSALSLSI